MATVQTDRNPMLRVMSLRDFRLLFSGASLSLLGDQFALIATPWLVLQLTGDPMALGLALALTGLPRAGFMLIGGVVTDRLSPRLVMLIADLVRLVLTALMAFAVLSGTIEIWMVYVFAFAFGTVAGFAMPAEHSIVPMLVGKSDLQAGNSLMMGIDQIAGFVGPSLAGIVIASFTDSLAGVGYAYAVDALSFAASTVFLFLIRSARPVADEDEPTETVLSAIRSAFAYVKADAALSYVFIVLAAINFLLTGPLLIGIPLVADTRLPEGAAAFGFLMSGFAVGSLIGYALAGALPRPNGVWVRRIMIAVLFTFAVIPGGLGLSTSTYGDIAILMLFGIGDGYISIFMFTWMQNRTPKKMLGRVMSLFIFANSGLIPLSQALAGALSKWDLTAMFLTASALSLIIAFWAATRPQLGAFSDSLAEARETAA